MNKYRVWIRSNPGFYEQYNGYVDVFAEDDKNAIQAALKKLKRTSFPDRDNSMWRIEKVEAI